MKAQYLTPELVKRLLGPYLEKGLTIVPGDATGTEEPGEVTPPVVDEPEVVVEEPTPAVDPLERIAPADIAIDDLRRRHLLSRLTYLPLDRMPSAEDVERAVRAEADKLPGPVYHRPNPDGKHPVVIGEEWEGLEDNFAYSGHSLRFWQQTLPVVVEDYGSIARVKMIEFWLAFFGVNGWESATWKLHFFRTLERLATGDYRELLFGVITESEMIRRLNMESNRAGNPNQDVGREILELYTTGILQNVVASDEERKAGTYAQADVDEASRIFTGLRRHLPGAPRGTPFYDLRRHDWGEKRFSAALGGLVIPAVEIESERTEEAMRSEMRAFINGVFQGSQQARYHVLRRLYRFFVQGEITAAVESQVIRPLGDAWATQGGFCIDYLRDRLFSSRHFLEPEQLGEKTSAEYQLPAELRPGVLHLNPIEFVTKTVRVLGMRVVSGTSERDQIEARYSLGRYVGDVTKLLGMSDQGPDLISGWAAYSESPDWTRKWVSAELIGKRDQWVNHHTASMKPAFWQGMFFEVLTEPRKYILATPTDTARYLIDLCFAVLPDPLQPIIDEVEALLLDGISPEHWTVDYPGLPARVLKTLRVLMLDPRYQIH